MATIARQILEQAMGLLPSERAALVESLLASLDQPDARIDELWSVEAENRLKAFEEGRMAAIPADEGLSRGKGLTAGSGRIGPVDDDPVMDRLLEPLGRALTPELARALVDLRAPAEEQDRIDELAEKCNEGTLSAEERAEYEEYVRAIHFVGTVQARARAILAKEPGQP